MDTIYLKEVCGAEVLSRSNVRKLYELVDETTERIDFNDVSFISRSVADELCNLTDKFQSVEFVGMTDDVATMLNIVKKGRNVKRDYRTKAKISMTFNCQSMDDLRKALLSFGL